MKIPCPSCGSRFKIRPVDGCIDRWHRVKGVAMNPGVGAGNYDRSACKYGHLRSKWTRVNSQGGHYCKACEPRWNRDHYLKVRPGAGTRAHPRPRPEKRTTHCKHGHERNERNTGWQFNRGKSCEGTRRVRYCKPCRKAKRKYKRLTPEQNRAKRAYHRDRMRSIRAGTWVFGSPPARDRTDWESVLESHGLGKDNETPWQEYHGLHDQMTNDRLPARSTHVPPGDKL